MAVNDILSAVLDYSTPKIVSIKSKKIGLLNRFVQAVIIGYIIIWVLIVQKGYQEVERGLTGVTTELTGISYAQLSSKHLTQSFQRVWDVTDIVVPAEENKAFFVSTNVIVTNNQTQSVCSEDSSVQAAYCETHSDCQPIGKVFLLGHGVSNGTCDVTTNTCFVRAWCPVENDNNIADTHQLLEGIPNFTVLIKNHIYFPEFEQGKSNIKGDKTYLSTCRYHPVTDRLCPVFRLGSVIDEALSKTSPPLTYDDLKLEGTVISIRIKWDCNLDYKIGECTPQYIFDRLDDYASQGYNYHYTHNYVDNGVPSRQLVKAYGILFIVMVNVQAGKFDIITTGLNLASGLVLLGVAQVISDFVVIYILRRKQFFKSRKYQTVQTPEDEEQENRLLIEETLGLADYGSANRSTSGLADYGSTNKSTIM